MFCSGFFPDPSLISGDDAHLSLSPDIAEICSCRLDYDNDYASVLCSLLLGAVALSPRVLGSIPRILCLFVLVPSFNKTLQAQACLIIISYRIIWLI